MPLLKRKENSEILISNLQVAQTFWQRGKGLLGRSSLKSDEGLWIHRCNSIHTFFMKFSIDCVFVDKNLKVKALYRDVSPSRLIPPVWGARSVFELSAGVIDQLQIQLGETLYVDS
ncbi:MAG TPA: DUF192 domain-containing protein [Pseudobdellovibrionaceae bacterium]|nr:DUF192 domain-containing protein [Pseudobdellovibrionaceae bacterium]